MVRNDDVARHLYDIKNVNTSQLVDPAVVDNSNLEVYSEKEKVFTLLSSSFFFVTSLTIIIF